MSANDFSLVVTDCARRKLDQMHMETDDALTVIRSAESTGSFVLQPSSGHRFAHLQIGSITLWTDYRPLDKNIFFLENVWAHRIQIIETWN